MVLGMRAGEQAVHACVNAVEQCWKVALSKLEIRVIRE